MVIDGGNSHFKDDVRRAGELRTRGIHYVDAGTSGGVWGLERGYCLMIGGDREVVERLDPIWKTLAPGQGTIPPTPAEEEEHCRRGLSALRSGGRGALREDGPQRHRVRTDAGLRRGLRHLPQRRFQGVARGAPLRARPRGHRGGLAARERDRFLAARSDGDGARRKPGPRRVHRLRAGLGRGAVDRADRDRRGGARERARRVAVRPLPLAAGAHLRGEGALRDALTSSAATSSGRAVGDPWPTRGIRPCPRRLARW